MTVQQKPHMQSGAGLWSQAAQAAVEAAVKANTQLTWHLAKLHAILFTDIHTHSLQHAADSTGVLPKPGTQHQSTAQHRVETHMQKQSRAAQNQRTATQVREDTLPVQQKLYIPDAQKEQTQRQKAPAKQKLRVNQYRCTGLLTYLDHSCKREGKVC